MEQRRPRSLQRQRAAAARLGQHAVGLVPHQRRAPGHRRQPADRLPGHLDGLQGRPRDRRRSSGSWAGSRAASRCRPLPARPSTVPGRSSPGSTTPRRSGTTSTPSSTTTRKARPLLPYSREVTVRLNLRDHVATLVSSDDQPEGLSASSQGNAQTLRTATSWSAGAASPTSRSSAVGPARLQRRVPGRGEHLPRLPAPVGRDARTVGSRRTGARAGT